MSKIRIFHDLQQGHLKPDYLLRRVADTPKDKMQGIRSMYNSEWGDFREMASGSGSGVVWCGPH